MTVTMTRPPAADAMAPMAFFDRDGVLNEEADYAFRIDQIVWVEGAFAAVRRLNLLGYRVVVVTNQSGVGRGYYTEDDVRSLHGQMNRIMLENGARIDAFYYSPHHPEAALAAYRADHDDRSRARACCSRRCGTSPRSGNGRSSSAIARPTFRPPRQWG